MGDLNCCSTKKKEEDKEVQLESQTVSNPIENDQNINKEDEDSTILILTIVNSPTLPVGTKIEINSKGLVNGSLRNKNDHITYFGYNESISNEIDNETSIDYHLPYKQLKTESSMPQTEHGKGRFFQISYNIYTKSYYIKDLGNGLGSFIKLKHPILLKNNTLLSIGDSFIVISFSVNEEVEGNEIDATSDKDYQGIGRQLFVRVFESKTKSKQMEYLFIPSNGKVIKIGRKKYHNDIELEDPLVSKVNCHIKYSENEGWIAIDGNEIENSNGDIKMQSSTNGTWYLPSEEYKIYEGMIFKSNFNLFLCNYKN